MKEEQVDRFGDVLSIEENGGQVYVQFGENERTQMSYDPDLVDELIEKLERAKEKAAKFRADNPEVCARGDANIARVAKAQRKV